MAEFWLICLKEKQSVKCGNYREILYQEEYILINCLLCTESLKNVRLWTSKWCCLNCSWKGIWYAGHKLAVACSRWVSWHKYSLEVVRMYIADQLLEWMAFLVTGFRFCITQGVRQGYVMSPWLFSLIMVELIRKVSLWIERYGGSKRKLVSAWMEICLYTSNECSYILVISIRKSNEE